MGKYVKCCTIKNVILEEMMMLEMKSGEIMLGEMMLLEMKLGEMMME